MHEPENPTLGRFFTFLRQREEQRRHDAGTLPRNRKLSREKAAGEAHITASYLTKLERDEVGRVDIGILRQLTDTYRANDEEWRYACDLAGYASPYPVWPGLDPASHMPSLEVFQAALTPIMHTEMAEATGDLVSFYTPQRRLLAANQAYYDTFPTHEPGLYLLEWSFTDEAKEVMINWDEQADVGVAWHRGMVGRYGHTDWAQEQHRRLWEFPEFRKKWENVEVAYARALGAETLVRKPDGDYVMIMENWQLQHHLPITRSRGRLYPADRAASTAS